MFQMTLLAEIRNLVEATDLDKFDNLLERREVSHVSNLNGPALEIFWYLLFKSKMSPLNARLAMLTYLVGLEI